MGPPCSAAVQHMFTQYIFTQFVFTAFYGRTRKSGNSPKKTTRFHAQAARKRTKEGQYGKSAPRTPCAPCAQCAQCAPRTPRAPRAPCALHAGASANLSQGLCEGGDGRNGRNQSARSFLPWVSLCRVLGYFSASRPGGLPNILEYSRLNCEGLSYPT